MNNTEEKMYSFWKEWFSQPLEEKMKHLRSPGKGGYYPPASESPGFTGKPDPKEYFHYRTGLWSGTQEEVTRAVFWQCWSKALDWLDEHGLGELNDAQRIPSENHVLRIIHYPANPEPIVGEAHRDFDLLTVSVDGTAPGLEVYESGASCNGEWCEPSVKPEECPSSWFRQEVGIQVGEMLEIYSSRDGCRASDPNDNLFATTHRVRTEPNTERFKAVFFYLPPNDFELRPGFTAGDYLKEALTKAGTYRIGAK